METFFKEVLSPLEIDLCSNDNVAACCHLDISTFLDFSHQDLDNSQLIEYEGLAIMHSPKTSTENSSFVQNRDRSVSLSSEVHSKNIAHVSFSLSWVKCKGLGLYENEPQNVATVEDMIATALESLDMNPIPALDHNDTLKRVNEEFEQSSVHNSIHSKHDDLSISYPDETIEKQNLPHSKISNNVNSTPDEPMVEEKHETTFPEKMPPPTTIPKPVSIIHGHDEDKQPECDSNPVPNAPELTE